PWPSIMWKTVSWQVPSFFDPSPGGTKQPKILPFPDFTRQHKILAFPHRVLLSWQPSTLTPHIFRRRNMPCQACGRNAPAKYVEFYQNIGMLVVRSLRSIKGNLCKRCIKKHF